MPRHKRNKNKLEELSKEELISKCKRYTHQITQLIRSQHKIKSENSELRGICVRLFEEYLESHTWEDGEGNISLTSQEIDIIQAFKDELINLNISITKDLSEYSELS